MIQSIRSITPRHNLALTLLAAASLLTLSACTTGNKADCCDKEDDKDNAVAVTMDQLPALVKATLMTNTAGGKIEELEKEVKKGQTIYSADAIIDGKKYDIEIAESGTLLSKEIEK